MPLTDAAVRTAKEGHHWDTNPKGFGLRVGKTTRTFIVILGPGKKHTIGRFPEISLGDARKKAKELLVRKRPPIVSPTFTGAVEQFLAHSAGKHRPSTTQYYGFGLAHFKFGRLSQITRADVLAQKPPAHALVALKVLFSWAVKSGLTETDPTFRMPSNSCYKPRERILTPKEVSTLIKHLVGAPSTFNRIVLLCLLTGQRRNEIAKLEWEWINRVDRTITLPSSVTKNKHAHTIPYGDQVAAVFDKTPILDNAQYVFPAARDHVRNKKTTTFNGWSKSKVKLDKNLPLAKWNLHDLRRTYSSTLASLGVRLEVTEKLLNHVSGSLSGVASTYNRYRYMDEMWDAVQRFEKHLTSLTAEA